jgi:hypothetical protein
VIADVPALQSNREVRDRNADSSDAFPAALVSIALWAAEVCKSSLIAKIAAAPAQSLAVPQTSAARFLRYKGLRFCNNLQAAKSS